ncbi:MAG: hypothetical protein M5U18_08300 [Dehalococcoidia bacterium]|nr:hypothetical protein [Dehalococcoidia bacterium]
MIRGISAFVLVILPESARPPAFEAHYPLIDPYYMCPEVPVCGCPLWGGNRRWKVQGTVPGGVFDGRVRGYPPLEVGDWMSAQDRLWEHNLVRPLEMAEPVSAYAVITPDGIWHECVEAESQDLVTQRGAAGASIASRELSRFQVAWRLKSPSYSCATSTAGCWA